MQTQPDINQLLESATALIKFEEKELDQASLSDVMIKGKRIAWQAYLLNEIKEPLNLNNCIDRAALAYSGVLMGKVNDPVHFRMFCQFL